MLIINVQDEKKSFGVSLGFKIDHSKSSHWHCASQVNLLMAMLHFAYELYEHHFAFELAQFRKITYLTVEGSVTSITSLHLFGTYLRY